MTESCLKNNQNKNKLNKYLQFTERSVYDCNIYGYITIDHKFPFLLLRVGGTGFGSSI